MNGPGSNWPNNDSCILYRDLLTWLFTRTNSVLLALLPSLHLRAVTLYLFFKRFIVSIT